MSSPAQCHELSGKRHVDVGRRVPLRQVVNVPNRVEVGRSEALITRGKHTLNRLNSYLFGKQGGLLGR